MNMSQQSGAKGDWPAGHRLYQGKYTVEQKLGCGGFGVTYLARDKESQQVVIKTLNQDVQVHPWFEKLRQDFFNEAIRLAKCSHHPHIVQIIELFEEEALPCIVMEYIPGNDLADWVEQNIITEAEAIYYIRQIAEALDTVHQQGFLHRDIKPQNIIITSDYALHSAEGNRSKAVLIDFGIAREYQQGVLTTHTTFISEGYSPIEQYYSEKQAAYTDVYSLAATLYFAVTGETPANAQRRHYNLVEYGTDPLITPKQINSEISEQVNTAIIQGMALNSETRSQTIQDWLDLLPEINTLPQTKVKNHVYCSGITQPYLPITPSFPTMPISRTRQSHISYWGVGLAIFLLIPPLIYFVINHNLYKNYISSIFVQENSLVYKNSYYGFSFKYAQNWVLYPKQSQDFTLTVAELVSLDSSNKSFEKIIIEVRDVASTHSLFEVKQETIKDIQKWFANSEILENRKAYLGEREAYVLVYQGRERSRSIRRLRVATVKNNREYAVIYEADMNNFALQRQSAQKIIDSFTWIN